MSNGKKTIHGQINLAREKKLKKLDFSDVEDTLDEIPDEIYELTDLVELNFGIKFSISKISNKIHNLKNLKGLTIIKSEFSEFPLELIEMKSLTKLSIQSQKIIELPKELNNWHSLKYLNLCNCDHLKRLNGLPPNLTYIYINGDSFEQFPEKIFELEKLGKIVAKNFKLQELPLNLFELKNLYALFFGDSKLKSIPVDILKLKNLQELWLNDNCFEEFPEIINQIQSLMSINIQGNYLNSIPATISNLINLKNISLGSNLFSEIPPPIFDLNNLVELNLGNFSLSEENKSKNSIKIIPNELLRLDKLKKLELFDNPIENIPQEIFKEGVDAIKNFLLSKIEADKEEFLYEAKMVVVGRGDVGKTVLTKKLSNPNYSLTESLTTRGISILKNPFKFKMDGLKDTNNFRFNIWDFGGQEKYDATHQLFITNRSIYLFLTEARDESNYQDVFYWLNTISLFSNNSPVIIVLSKFDERKKLLPESVYKEKFKNIVEFVDVSCADGYEYTIESLKSAIKEAVKLLPQTKLTISNHWVDIRNELEILAQKENYIDYEKYLSICKKHKLDKVRADFLSEYLNDLGVIIHHQQDLLLKKTVFINTDWCVDGMYKVLDDDSVFQNKGKFSNQDLSIIWSEGRFESKQAELVRLMRDYSLCFELSDGSGYLAPDLLPPDKPNNFNWDFKSTLQFEYQYTFMPAGMVSRFIVKSHGFIYDNLYWKYGVVLKYDNTEALVEEDYIHNKIKISLRGENKKGLLSAIKMLIEEVHKDFDKANELVFEEMVPCNCTECITNIVPHFYKYNVLKRFEQKSIVEIPCELSSESVRIKSLINDVQIHNPIDYFETDNDLKNFIWELLEDILEKEISLKGGYLSFWRDKQCKNPKDEVEVHPYICNTLDNYCKVKGINLAREVKEANGNVDILFSCTNKEKQVLKVCIEVKKAHHNDIETAINTQLPLYMKSAGTLSGIYLVLWFKNKHFTHPNKHNSEDDLQIAIDVNNPDHENIAIKIINCCKDIVPSKRKLTK